MRTQRIRNFNITTAEALEKAMSYAKNDPKRLKRLKMAVARQFGLPTYKHVNLEKTVDYMRYRASITGKIEEYLDDTFENRLISDTGARKL